MFSTCSRHVLGLQFSCTELVIQWTICRYIVDAKIRASDKDLPVTITFRMFPEKSTLDATRDIFRRHTKGNKKYFCVGMYTHYVRFTHYTLTVGIMGFLKCTFNDTASFLLQAAVLRLFLLFLYILGKHTWDTCQKTILNVSFKH